ncbi:MAG TPA: hypothetical protein VGD46_16460 [Rhizobacter sp.]
MPRRLLCFLLALLTCWSALATQEQAFLPLADPAGAPTLAAAVPHADPRSDGSVIDHHLDDQPVQAVQPEASPDLPGLLGVPCRMSLCIVAAGPPGHAGARPLPAPCLDGPQRPPPSAPVPMA